MSSYDSRYDPHDYRPPRRHDSFTKPRGHLNPNTGRNEKPYGPENGRYDARRADGRYHDSRQRSPHSGLSSDEQRSRRARSPRQPRYTWPPQPTVESEARSLARELGGNRVLRDSVRNEIPSRGTIDQDPVIEEVAEYANLHERRFVMVSDSESGRKSQRGVLTPPTSEDERLRKARRRPSRINTDFSDARDGLPRRTASPYAMSRPTASRQHTAPSEAYLSPSVSALHDTHKDRSPRVSPSRRANDYLDRGKMDVAVDDGEDDTRRSTLKGSGTRRSATLDAPSRDTRRATETAASIPTSRNLDTSYRPSPLVVASALAAASKVAHDIAPKSASLNPPAFNREGGLGSRNASPAASVHSQRSSSPPARSPRFSREMSQEQNSSPESRRASAVSSKAGSRDSSPPPFASVAMPRMPQMPSSDLDWNQLLAANATRRGAPPNNARPPSRLSTSMRADSSPILPRSGSVSSRPAALPYPINEGPMTPEVYMPVEQDHQWLPPVRAGQPNMPEYQPDNYAPTAAVMVGAPTRPPQPTRHSFTNTSPVEPRAPGTRPELVARPSHANVIGPTKQEAEAMLKRGLPDCSRPDPIANRDDWYTMVGAPALNFCPKCIEAIFERTVYRKYFRRALPCDLNTKIACAFGSPWIRLAYLLTVQQRLADLQLFKDLADIEANSDPCPKGQEAVRTWYGLKDDQGLFVRDFQVCYTDVRKLERLLPTFSGFFQKLPGRSSWEKKRCSLRAATNRFTQYLNTIIEMHDQAHTMRTLPDPMPFVLLVERKLSLRECERDSLILGGLWHYIPAVPAFTVCEDCYEEVIEPEVKKGVDIAKRFNQTIQPAYGESIGTSCQLYSARMRRVFARSIKENDLKYLARKAKERREAELRLQDKQTGLIQRLERVENHARGGGIDDEESRRRLTRELRHITLEWKEEWE